MKRKVFFKILAMTALCLLLLFAAGIIITYVSGRNMIRQRLSTETRLVASLLDDSSDYEEFDAYYNNDELRVTVISLTGEVLFESDKASMQEMENHLSREEVQYALAGEPKAVERYSETFQCEMTYYAVVDALADGTEIILRLALKGSQISSYVFATLPFLILSLLLAIVVASVFANNISDSLAEKITQVGDSLKSLNAGEYMPLETNPTEPEFYSVFNEINELNESTHEHIRREENEHKKLDAVLGNVAQGIVALGGNKEIAFVNDSALATFGGRAADVGKNLAFLIDDARLCEKIDEKLGEDIFTFEYEYNGKYLSVAGKKIADAGEQSFTRLLIFTDVTSEKQMIRQKSDFFANASHELKTPITVMRGLTEILLSKEDLDEQERKQIERIHKESLRMASLIADMLKLSKLERGEEEEPVEVALHEIAQEVLAELAVSVKEKELSVLVTGEGTVRADSKKIFELMQNLCSNAVNYNKQKGKLLVEITETESCVTLKVQDSGIGIEKEHIPRLCERFYRVDKSRSKKTGGTGLGLAIVKHVCALYKAELTIESEIDEGTCVTVKFPK